MLSVKLAFSSLYPVKAIKLKGKHLHTTLSVSFLLYSSQGWGKKREGKIWHSWWTLSLCGDRQLLLRHVDWMRILCHMKRTGKSTSIAASMQRSLVIYIGSPISAWFVCLFSYAVNPLKSSQGDPGESIATKYRTPRYGSPEGNHSHSLW